ncbi:MAG TPA: 16S rRNA (uracil(1498)-N(3))-methyltransferase [Fervidobacterium sp.]|nr:16S rRNA (uracil(1498)-N(3))-methyltransferase [Fervidobacterium sp.]NLH38118.1 16S rRNA (uracil(1498)-N(3))-methyltransferase [Thermotogaceae bacterium]MBP8657191.1 16S rRNA (uracil(1498)-N(3))-methyltransferase [Fervidobacterium sp.]MBP9518013.1 16S rRNA (uracil(1498)-N(3))-methyltransferase [Fervidobacterium sp.]HCL98775.1 16S rRNA (uracil(1498)-N(3))-methyltransferase [Fervidobacterium sp.]
MPNIFYGVPGDSFISFDEHEVTHMKVMRIKQGEIIDVTDGNGGKYKIIVDVIGKQSAQGKVLSHEFVEPSDGRLVLFAPSGRWERLRWTIEKAVELGVDEIYIFNNERASRHYDDKQEKLEIVVREASKQCVRYHFPDIKSIEFLDIFSLAPESTYMLDFKGRKIPKRISKNVGIIAGPEGGFSKKETELLKGKFRSICLGKKILRFETAIILSMGVFSMKLGKI